MFKFHPRDIFDKKLRRSTIGASKDNRGIIAFVLRIDIKKIGRVLT